MTYSQSLDFMIEGCIFAYREALKILHARQP